MAKPPSPRFTSDQKPSMVLGVPAPDADWAGAREAYETAARLGSYSPEMFRDLALVDEHLGDHAAALAAARKALSLDRYDTDSQALVKSLGG